jgi:SAM-dependent methyltransferase
MEKKSLFDRIKIKIEKKFANSEYGEKWPKKNDEWYAEIHNSNYLIHENFKKYLSNKKDIKSILEVGCGTGIYPIKNKNLFENIDYTGIDISDSAIEFCKNNSSFEFIVGDFIKMNISKKYDLVFSHAVVDHVYDIDEFISKIVNHTKKYAYINSYRGFFPNLEEHKMTWDGHEACYYNNLSIKQIKKLLIKLGLNEDEFKIYSEQSGQKEENLDNQTIIEIHKK